MKRRDMKLLLEERFERIALLETRIDTMDQLVEGYRAREQAIFDTLSAAKENAAKMLEQAKAEGAQIRAEAEAVLADAEQVRLNAHEEAEALLADAILTANTLKAEAEKKGNEMTASIRADSERMLRDAEIIKREYEEMVDSFNAMLEQNASELEVTAARFGEFVKNRKIDRSEARLDGNAFYKSVGEMNDANLPDASGDPSLLMQNIYRIQNRPLPEDRIETPAQETQQSGDVGEAATAQAPEFPMEDGNGADERRVAQPYSEQAWVNEAQQSESEPQAEFTRVYSDDFVNTDYTVHMEACAVTQEDAVSAFDEIVTEHEAGEAAAAAIPLGSAVLAADIAAQPQTDISRAVDEYFDASFEPSAKLAQDAVPQEAAQGPEGSVPEHTETPAVPNAATAPEPYSEQAWAQSNFASDYEPQAEGALFTDASAYPIEPEKREAPASEPVSTIDVESAFDAYLTQVGAISNAATTPAPAPEPYSEQAWAQSDITSDHEPQAESALFVDTYSFEPAIPQAELPPEPAASAKPVSAVEAESAFDEYLTQIGEIPNVQPTATAPEPYSEQAWAQSAAASEYEPQAEGALFGDINAYLSDSLKQSDAFQTNDAAPESFPTANPAMASSEPVPASAAESAFDEYLSQIGMNIPADPATPAAPEPYSQLAWAQSASASEYEPQAEGESYFSNRAEEEEEPEPAPAPRRYNEYGEIREWEPEPEPDMGDIPTVSRYMGESGDSDDISLDQLLDEIIKAGE